jgi:hypothetical protein
MIENLVLVWHTGQFGGAMGVRVRRGVVDTEVEEGRWEVLMIRGTD